MQKKNGLPELGLTHPVHSLLLVRNLSLFKDLSVIRETTFRIYPQTSFICVLSIETIVDSEECNEHRNFDVI